MSEFTFQGQGTLLRVDTFVSKAGKSIITLIFEAGGQYPQTIPIKVFGRLAEQAAAWKPGTTLTVSGRLGGREWQGKVYGDNVASHVEVMTDDATGRRGGAPDEGAGPPEREGPPPSDEDAPF